MPTPITAQHGQKEHMKKKLGRKPIPENKRRVKISFRVAPETAKQLKKQASLFGECPGRFLDFFLKPEF